MTRAELSYNSTGDELEGTFRLLLVGETYLRQYLDDDIPSSERVRGIVFNMDEDNLCDDPIDPNHTDRTDDQTIGESPIHHLVHAAGAIVSYPGTFEDDRTISGEELEKFK